jgi:uncharacterized protein
VSQVVALVDLAPELERVLRRSLVLTPPRFAASDIRIQTIEIAMRDKVRLATDIYLPPSLPAPVIAIRTPYGRAMDTLVGVFLFFARRGYVVVSQDCRGTGDSEPDQWDYYVYEPEDGYDFIEWVSRQTWFNGFIGSCGSSYAGQNQWHMALHPNMSTIVPEVSGLGVAINTVHLHMFCNAYARSVGKGAKKVSLSYIELERQMLDETLASGYFNEPLFSPLPDSILLRFPPLRTLTPFDAQRWLWQKYCSFSCAQRAELIKELMGTTNVRILDVEGLSAIFGHRVAHDAHTLPHPRPEELCRTFHTPVLLRTGWYDWGLNDALATWELLQRAAPERMRARCRLLIAPSAHNMPGYHEGMGEHPELHHSHTVANNSELLLRWYTTIQDGKTDAWPTVIYYLMGANQWCIAGAWPPGGSRNVAFYFGSGGSLSPEMPDADSPPDRYTYDPRAPTPTVGGSIVSYVYPPGSVDVNEVQKRPDVLVYTSAPLKQDLVVVGPLRVVLYASSTAVDTDFAARLTDVFPDGRAVQLQNGVLRARYRNPHGDPELLSPGGIYRLEIDMWATANRFNAGHRVRVDISSADFPRFDRNSNRGGEPGGPIAALQTIYHSARHPSHLMLPVIG